MHRRASQGGGLGRRLRRGSYRDGLETIEICSWLRAQGDYAEARPLYERALAIYEKVLGAEHPDTKTIRENLSRLGKEANQSDQE